jgi:hypothetical protein
MAQCKDFKKEVQRKMTYIEQQGAEENISSEET